MKLLLHVVHKDVRHFYPEILVNLALLVAFSWVAPSLWLGGSAPTMNHLVEILLRGLLPIGGVVLVARVMHDEPLVGDRQFWITRPYSRAMLLCEKLSFFLLFVHLPIFLVQVYLLHRAGLPIAPALGGLLAYQARFFFLYLLPVMALAAVTANFSQNLLWLLGSVIWVLTVVAFTGWVMREQMSPPHMD